MALDGRVLLLNQTYEPLGTVSVARAVIMTFKNTVTVEEFDGDRVLRSARAEFPVPSVIRRRIYINVRQRREASGTKRLRIYVRDKYRCQYCGEKKAGRRTDVGPHPASFARRRQFTGEHRYRVCSLQRPQGESHSG
jgi:hypothetical protein